MRGIDYGKGLANIDHANGIRYGVINQNAVLQAWCDSADAVWPECDCCGGDCDCMDDCEPLGFAFDADGYQAECGDSGDIFITKSPFYTRAAFCSPCAPGACYLESPDEEGERAYCFGHDWFDEGKAPYPVYRVADDSAVKGAEHE